MTSTADTEAPASGAPASGAPASGAPAPKAPANAVARTVDASRGRLDLGLSTKASVAAVGFTVAVLSIVASASFWSAETALRTSARQRLIAVGAEKAAATESWFAAADRLIGLAAGQPGLAGLVAPLRANTAAGPGTGADDRAAAQVLALLRPWATRAAGFSAVSLIEADRGEVLVSTAPDEVGKLVGRRRYFRAAFAGAGVREPFYSLTLRRPVVYASAPVRATDGTVVAVIAGLVDLTGLTQALLRSHAAADMVDAFVLNDLRLFVTQPRHLDDPAVLKRGIRTETARRCVAGTAAIVDAVDYRGRHAITLFRPVPSRRLCLVVALDRAAVLAPLHRHGAIALAIMLVGAAIAALAAVLLVRGALGPVIALADAAGRVSNGDFSVRVRTDAADEIGRLADAFNHMTRAIARREQAIAEAAQERGRLAAEAARQQTLFETVLSSSADPICVFDADGRPRYVNPVAITAWGLTPDGATDKDAATAPADPRLAAYLRDRVARVRADGIGQRGERVSRCGGWKRLYTFAFSPIDDPAGGVLCIGRDITEARQREHRLERLADRLRASNQELERFAYVASHDLQEPLRKVSSFCRLLGTQYADAFDAKGRRFLDYVIDGATRMQTLINDLLQLSRVDSRGQRFLPVEVGQLVAEVRDALSHLIAKSGGRVEIGPLPTLAADGRQLAQLFQNLIVNALRYRRDAPPVVTITATDQGDRWHFSVRDNGIGIADQYYDRIFEIFQRLHGQAEFKGTGIGLAICKKIVERHQGKIWVTSVLGQGSDFQFTLPRDLDRIKEDEQHDDAI